MQKELKIMKIEERIAEGVKREVARIFKKDGGEITRDMRFVEDLHAKSVNIVALIALWENEFGIEIPFMQARRKKTVGEAIDFIIELRKG
jgi:acyl carrier protein